MARTKIRDRKTAQYRRLKKLTKKPAEGVEVGVFDPELARIGSYHEFGTTSIPQRSFLRSWFAKEGDDFVEDLRKAMELLYKGKTPDAELKRIGLAAVTGIRTTILAKIPPKLQAETVAQKTGAFKTTPLIDRGRLFRAIEYKLTKKSK